MWIFPLLFLLSLFPYHVHSWYPGLDRHLCAPRSHMKAKSKLKKISDLKIKVLNTEYERAWGLMRRKRLSKNEGVLLDYRDEAPRRVWAFNCFIDLDIVFLNKSCRVIKLDSLRARPQLFSDLGPINSFDDLKKVPQDHPAIIFFTKTAAHCEKNCRYVLEMPKSWVQIHHIKIGDQFLWSNELGENTKQILCITIMH